MLGGDALPQLGCVGGTVFIQEAVPREMLGGDELLKPGGVPPTSGPSDGEQLLELGYGSSK